ncbi:WcaF family extracellular polysaccharide biosynthesis acetyltransferase [Puniceibacterium sp. IMCC21224]|uniref:WcaF family extracellular polysaccharide biosynthesis acetyltransferase n=1 Tax=Puniceibacterium sp. IMCC21224 TaxID=1618204 RepID=UPI00064D7E0A|nr:WcaF family extracellular polysaccharide biosynthesis acetyltransferase [Puniceibacterium sp. IMCC21224]KMK63832.1 acetyltransferase (isoleucine patch superfamily) [Puniceibacterium sp. IMCC21224]
MVQRLSDFRVPPGFRGRSALFTQVWWIVQACLIRPSPQPCYAWRVFWLRLFGAQIGDGVMIRQSARVTYPWKVTIGDNSWIGDRAELYSLERIEIGSNVCISQDCYLCTGSHDMTDPAFGYACGAITVEDESWLAAGTFVAPGVTVRRGAVAGARSVVLHDMAAGMVHAGQPARPIRPRIVP